MASPSSISLREATPRPLLREVGIFYGVTLGFAVLTTVFLWRLPADFLAGDMAAIEQAVGRVGAVAVYAPAVTALACTLAFAGWSGLGGLLRRIATVRISPFYYLAALALPVAPQWMAAFVWAQVSGAVLSYPEPVSFLAYWLQVTVFGAVVLLGEEIGWRGFVLPRLLARFGWRSAAIIAGALWSFWHFPFWAPANYAATGSVFETGVILLFASLGAIALSVVITWLFVRTRYSVALAALLHSSGNGSMGEVYSMLGAGAGGLLWPIVYNVVLIAVATVFLVLPDRQSAERRPPQSSADFGGATNLHPNALPHHDQSPKG